jgi:hypothetical protein
MLKVRTWRKAEDDRAALQEERDESDRVYIARVLARRSLQDRQPNGRVLPLPPPRRTR